MGAEAHSILIVEDERIVAKDLQETLVAMGYDAWAIARSVDEALKRAAERRPDVVLMDIRIKGPLDGIEGAALLRKQLDVPVIFLTAHADESTLERAKRSEPHGYLLKPVKPAELRVAVEISIHRHRMEAHLRSRERWFATTLDSIADGVVSVDVAGNVSFMNPAAEALTGVRSRDAVGRPASEVVRILDAKAGNESPLDRALRARAPVEVPEAGLVGEGAASRIISDTAAPVMDGDELLGAVMVFRDVTKHKLAQKQVELADRLASLGTMASGVAHEINNPLAVLVANTTFALEQMATLRTTIAPHADAETDALFEELLDTQVENERAAGRITRIVGDLRVFGRPPQHQSARSDVARAVEWAVRVTQHELRHRARVTTTVAELPPAHIDHTRLGQVLVNLLINAAHAIPAGAPEEHSVLMTARFDSDLGRIVIEVRDSGVGMPPEVVQRVFEPFFTTKSVGEGMGLGLAVSHGMVRSAGGHMEAESVVGQGSVFRVFLPAVVAHAPSLAPDGATGPTGRRARVLVIDDEPSLLRALQRTLREHEPVCVESASVALALIDAGAAFDLILSDVVMPSMTGIELYRTLARRSPELAARVVFLTGGALTPDEEMFFASIPNRRLHKPFDTRGLLGVVQAALGSRAVC